MGFDSNDCSHVDTETLDILHRYVRFEFASRKAAVLTSFPLHSPDFYAGDPYPAYRELRATTPVVWNDVTKFWALTSELDYAAAAPYAVLMIVLSLPLTVLLRGQADKALAR